jgi:DNA-directed RNA polymerase specialized sigma24 family protein
MVGQAIAISPPLDEVNPSHSERLARLFDAHHARLYSLARRMTASADAARDVVQETFLRGARSPNSIPHGASQEEAWLVRVLVNICRDDWRKQAVRRVSSSRGNLLDSTFSIAVGETVVIGTSRLKGDQALIALLTAAGKPGASR